MLRISCPQLVQAGFRKISEKHLRARHQRLRSCCHSVKSVVSENTPFDVSANWSACGDCKVTLAVQEPGNKEQPGAEGVQSCLSQLQEALCTTACPKQPSDASEETQSALSVGFAG